MIHFTTDDLSPEDRFEQWREVRGRSLFGVTIELAADRRNAFRGSFRAHNVGTALATEMRASAYRVNRTQADIARIAGHSLCISLQVKGPGALKAGGDRTDTVRNGDMMINYSDLPYSAIPTGRDDFHFKMLKVPVDDELMLGRPAHDLFATKSVEGAAFSRPFRALFNAVNAEPGKLADPHADVAHIARLAMTARGRLAPGIPEVRAALRAGLRYAAQEIMARNKHRHALSPANVALELGISVRQLHVVFESGELSFTRTLSRMRLEEARRLLLSHPGLSVTQVAYACGFESLSTFYRLFGNAYGMTPSDMREAGLTH